MDFNPEGGDETFCHREKIFRKIRRTVKRNDGGWRLRKNKGVGELFAEPKVIRKIKAH